MRLYLFVVIFFLHHTCIKAASYSYDYSANCSKAYESYLALHIKEARIHLLNEINANPYNLMATYIADYEDCILLLLNCDKAEYEQRESRLDEKMDLLDKGDKSSPWFRLCKAGVYLHWAIIDMRFGKQYAAARYFHKSFGLLKDNQRLFPSFEYNNTFSGLEEAVVGSLPGSYKWLASIFGMKGNVMKGTAKLAAFVSTHNAGQPMYSETVLYYLYTRFYLLQEQKQVWDYISSAQFPLANNLLNVYVKANLSLDYRKAQTALETLQGATHNSDYSLYSVFDYQWGVALLSKADTGCTYYFQQYLAKNKSDLYIKDCWQKMAFAWYMNGDMQKAEYCRQQVLANGTARIDADKQAQKFAENNKWPLKKLLQARLLIEGGYNAQALTLLNSIDTAGIANIADKAEYYFRMGRVYEESESYPKALQSYQSAINTGRNRHEQFAARAALHMGKIYERTGRSTQAISRYNECLNMPEHDFQNSIDQQAKAGINRVEGK